PNQAAPVLRRIGLEPWTPRRYTPHIPMILGRAETGDLGKLGAAWAAVPPGEPAPARAVEGRPCQSQSRAAPGFAWPPSGGGAVAGPGRPCPWTCRRRRGWWR